jgi:Negative regulator of sigma E activity
MLRRKKQFLCTWLMVMALNVAPAYADADLCEGCQSPVVPSWSEADIQHLIARIGWAAQQQDFSGRYIISQADQLLALHTTHIFTDEVEYELVTTLTGDKLQVFRRDDAYYSIDVQAGKVLFERQSSTQLFPFWGKPGYGWADQFYTLSVLGTERFLNRDTDVIQVIPRDDKRFGYKVWLDRETGLLLRLEVEETQGLALQRFMFTEIELQSATEAQKSELVHYIDTLEAENFQTTEWPFVYGSAQEQGWQLTRLPRGFESVTCVLRDLPNEEQKLMQWVFSDGVATVSVFIEHRPGSDEHEAGTLMQNGATHGIFYPFEEWKVTLVGEVPEKTLYEFASALRRISTEEK